LVERLDGANGAQEIAARAGDFLRPIRAALDEA
jgi:tryptophan synthase alpha chain